MTTLEGEHIFENTPDLFGWFSSFWNEGNLEKVKENLDETPNPFSI